VMVTPSVAASRVRLTRWRAVTLCSFKGRWTGRELTCRRVVALSCG
jgi:hypothetical protein